MLSRAEIIERANLLAGISETFEFRISKPATVKEIAWRRKQIPVPIPEGVSELAAHTASRIYIQWQLDARNLADKELDPEFCDSGDFEFNFFRTDLSTLEGWQDSFVNWKNYRQSPNPFAYEEVFPVFSVGNGDILVSIIGENDNGAIYYLDHEGGDGDWRRLANSYDQFVTTLARLWFPSLDWYDSLERFYDEDQKILSDQTHLARQRDAFIRSLG